MEKLFWIDEHAAGMRLDRFLHEQLPGISRHELIQLIEQGNVTSNNHKAKKGMFLKVGDHITVELPYQTGGPSIVADPDIHLDILFEDEYLVAIDKPPGVPTHPLRIGERGTVANALVYRYPEMGSVGFSAREPGILHRLDRDTSGVLLAARTQSSFETLRLQFQQQEVVKTYEALVLGYPDTQGEIDQPIGAPGRRSERVKVVVGPRKGIRGISQAHTHYRSIRYLKGCSLIRVWISSGARHQIRAHLAFLGHPVLGDTLYGGVPEAGDKGMSVPRLMLHAASVQFYHPASRQPKEILCPLPRDFQMVLDALYQ